jgi:hypothetical protein
MEYCVYNNVWSSFGSNGPSLFEYDSWEWDLLERKVQDTSRPANRPAHLPLR